ncbi:DUF397 domain-containing protein [Actinacidiphila epipremni]|jgi:hypothetical protein|uniref:DUF397 domain-containing protein n=1 Tax=Actinacidiphila epipremni TaxID=2053013 RepID=A0ABX0ZXG6_9ACTN|nr:DUF397 domain-containing protein [Actinacidiphila epipremni]NJP46409.1 DUF397 domain-containing protein [Actinacidiphila epipremni]
MTAPSPSIAHVRSSLELGAVAWRRSSHSTAANNCVETAGLPSGQVAVRDSKDVTGPALLFPEGAWGSFVQALATGTLAAR